jgi:drug/metabolite transporter (DMT)-like permease
MWLTFILLSSLGWALVNVLDSLLVRHYEKHPVVLMWSQSLFSVVVLAILACFYDLHTSWWPLLFAMGLCAYLADLFFFWVLGHLDVSITNAAWPILSIFLSIAGFALFQESWTLLQATGSALILAGVFFLSFHHAESGSLLRTLGILLLLAALYIPTYVAKKAALLAGQDVVAVFFWLIIGRETIALLLPCLVPAYRKRIKHLVKVMDWKFFAIGGAVIACFLFGEFTGGLSYLYGPISLVSVVSNIQPFMVIGLAAFMAWVLPSYAPKELLSARSVRVKLVSFGIVFLGLALLTLPK